MTHLGVDLGGIFGVFVMYFRTFVIIVSWFSETSWDLVWACNTLHHFTISDLYDVPPTVVTSSWRNVPHTHFLPR